ncbi:MAG: catalase [Halobacteriovoraceae bacterium]|nr:catalase [Halobacteriovoraceae bacterium]
MKTISIVLLGFILIGCSSNNRGLSSASNQVSEEQPPVEQGEIWGPKQMEEATLVRNQFRDMLEESTADSPQMKRDAHPKHHGCVEAKLEINNTRLPEKHRVGIFENTGNYRSVVRFSNGDPNPLKSDTKKDVRGMAIKVFDVPYENYLTSTGVEQTTGIHDFVFMNSDSFFIKNPAHYGKFMNAVRGGGLSLAGFGAFAFINPRDKFLSILLKAFNMKVGNPLDINYHSATPYKLGPDSMKMMFKTCKRKKTKLDKKRGDNYLSQKLQSYLDKNGTCFDFYVQPNRDPKKNDIENGQKKWSTKKSPFIKVGKLHIPQQSKQSILDKNEACENSSFNPWRAPLANRPLGGVNRIRLEVYVKQAKMRHGHNGVIYPGPSF